MQRNIRSLSQAINAKQCIIHCKTIQILNLITWILKKSVYEATFETFSSDSWKEEGVRWSTNGRPSIEPYSDTFLQSSLRYFQNLCNWFNRSRTPCFGIYLSLQDIYFSWRNPKVSWHINRSIVRNKRLNFKKIDNTTDMRK